MNEPPIPAPSGDEPCLCPQCAALVARNAPFCPNCGAKLSDAQTAATPSAWSIGRVFAALFLGGMLLVSCGVGACSVWAAGTSALSAGSDAEGFAPVFIGIALLCLLVSAGVGWVCLLALKRLRK